MRGCVLWQSREVKPSRGKVGDADQIFNGDVNMHLTDVNALHMAAMAGQEGAVKLLLEAQADPHVRCVVARRKGPTKW